MTSVEFFNAFLAALVLENECRIDTENDQHHEQFSNAWLDVRQLTKTDNATKIIEQICSKEVSTKRYPGFDDALLLDEQNTWDGKKVTLAMTRHTAAQVLGNCQSNYKKILRLLAKNFT